MDLRINSHMPLCEYMMTCTGSKIKLLFLFMKLLTGNLVVYKLFPHTLASCVYLKIVTHLELHPLFQESDLLLSLFINI